MRRKVHCVCVTFIYRVKYTQMLHSRTCMVNTSHIFLQFLWHGALDGCIVWFNCQNGDNKYIQRERVTNKQKINTFDSKRFGPIEIYILFDVNNKRENKTTAAQCQPYVLCTQNDEDEYLNTRNYVRSVI